MGLHLPLPSKSSPTSLPIEGEAAMYEVAAADATSFAFSRFDAQEITGPVDVRLASAVDATSTDEAFTST